MATGLYMVSTERKWKVLLFPFLIFFSSACFSLAGPAGDSFSIKEELVPLIDKAPDLHDAFQKKDQNLIRLEINATQRIIKTLYGRILNMTHLQQRGHAFRLLKALEEQLESIRFQDMSYELDEKKYKKRLFNSFVELARVYGLRNTERQAFYCHLDQSAWIQSGSKPLNPVNPHYKNCGRRIW